MALTDYDCTGDISCVGGATDIDVVAAIDGSMLWSAVEPPAVAINSEDVKSRTSLGVRRTDQS